MKVLRIGAAYVSITCAVLFFSFSCSHKNDCTKEIVLLDSASVKLKQAEYIILSLDTNILNSAYESSVKKLHFISEKIKNDTFSKQTAIVLNSAFEQTKNLQNLIDNKKFLLKATGEGYKRIDDLKHDLQKGLIEKSESVKYIQNEINSSEKLHDLITTAIQRAHVAVNKLDSLKTKITLLADSLASQ